MTFESERDKEEASLRLLRALREKLVSGNISEARSAAHNLSWLQEDGLSILKEALFGDYPKMSKQAAAYGLRKVNGRMTKMAVEVLEQGLRHRDRNTRDACAKSLCLMGGQGHTQQAPGKRPLHRRRRISEAPAKRRQVMRADSEPRCG